MLRGIGVDSGQVAFVPIAGKELVLDKYDHEVGLRVKLRKGHRYFVGVKRGFEFGGMRVQVIETLVIDTDEMYIGDPCYIMDGDFNPDEGADNTGNPYARACVATCYTPMGFGKFDVTGEVEGFCSSTAFGDGCYDYTLDKDQDGYLRRCMVTFEEEEPEHSEEDEWNTPEEDEES